MVGFERKEIANPLNLGEQLKSTREGLGLSLDEISQATSIAVKYLDALETGKQSVLPGEVYTRSFLKVYAGFLGLNQQKILAAYKSEQKIYAKVKKQKHKDFHRPVARVSPFHLVVTPKIVRSLIIVFLAFICLIYLGAKVKGIMTPPKLTVTNPVDNLVTDNNFIEIIGQTEKEAKVEINGQQILTNTEGNFQETIDLQVGVNTIEIKAQSRHGKETKIYRKINVTTSNSSE